MKWLERRREKVVFKWGTLVCVWEEQLLWGREAAGWGTEVKPLVNSVKKRKGKRENRPFWKEPPNLGLE